MDNITANQLVYTTTDTTSASGIYPFNKLQGVTAEEQKLKEENEKLKALLEFERMKVLRNELKEEAERLKHEQDIYEKGKWEELEPLPVEVKPVPEPVTEKLEITEDKITFK